MVGRSSRSPWIHVRAGADSRSFVGGPRRARNRTCASDDRSGWQGSLMFGLWCAAHRTPAASLLGTLPGASEPAEAGAVARRLRQRLGGADAPRAHGGLMAGRQPRSGGTPGAGVEGLQRSSSAWSDVTTRNPGVLRSGHDAMKAKFMTLVKTPKPVVVTRRSRSVGPQGRAGAGAGKSKGPSVGQRPERRRACPFVLPISVLRRGGVLQPDDIGVCRARPA